MMKAFPLLITCVLLIGAVPGRRSVVKADDHGVAARLTPDARAKTGADDLRVETRTGEAVALRAAQLKRKNKGVARAMKELERRGLRPAFDMGASVLAVSRSGRFRKAARQDQIIDGDVELTFISYDDGDDSTWEGIIYYRSPTVERTDYVVINIADETPAVTNEQNYSYQPLNPSGQPMDWEGAQQRSPKRAGYAALMTSFAARPGAAAQGATQVQEWLDCSTVKCLWSAVTCLRAGKGWPKCVIAACVIAMIECAIEQL